MLAFFVTVGLTADLTRLKYGWISLLIFLLVVTLYLTIQNMIGASMAYVRVAITKMISFVYVAAGFMPCVMENGIY